MAQTKKRGRPAKVKLTDPSLVYYGPHPCKDQQNNRKEGNTGCDALIVKAGNGAPNDLEFNYPTAGCAYPNTVFTPHVCPTAPESK